MKARTDYVSHFHTVEVAGDPETSGNGIKIAPAAASASPAITAVGDDSNVDITLTPKGTGRIRSSATAQVLTSAPLVAGGSALTLTEALHNGKTIALDTAAGTTITLPAASGSGAIFRFLVTLLATSNSHVIKVANANDTMIGIIETMSDDPATMKGFAAGATSDTITLNRTTTGSVTKGEWIEVRDVAANVFAVRGVTTSTGTEATPFSATVS